MSEEKKLRHSRQRDRIQEYVCSSKEHPSAEKIYLDLKEEMPSLSLGTVYRNLKQLEETGMVQKVMAGNIERYEAAQSTHAHFICRKCGKVVDLDSIDKEALLKLCHVGNDDIVEKASIILEGVCAECAAKENN